MIRGGEVEIAPTFRAAHVDGNLASRVTMRNLWSKQALEDLPMPTPLLDQ
jgi:hypothetical protein